MTAGSIARACSTAGARLADALAVKANARQLKEARKAKFIKIRTRY
jgi:hypothetical protein